MKNIKTLTLSKSDIERIDSCFVRGVDKWIRMYAGMSSNLEKYENDIIYLRIENTEKHFPSNYETAIKRVKTWIEFNKELCDAKEFVVSFYNTKSTGFVLNHEDLKDGNKINQVVEELKSSGKQKLECISVFFWGSVSRKNGSYNYLQLLLSV